MKNSKWFLVGVVLGLVVFVVIMWVLFESGQIHLNSEPLTRSVRSIVYYVSPSGSGTSCTNAAPCALTTPVLQSGDVLYLKGGTYVRGATLNITASNVIISSAPGEHAIISGDVNGNNAVDETDGPRVDGSHQWTPLVKLSGNYITFKDIEVKLSGGRGVQTGGDGDIVSGNTVHHTWTEGIKVYGPNNLIEGNTVYRAAETNYCGGTPGSRECNGNWPGGLVWGWSGEANPPGPANHVTIRNNTVYHTSGEGLLCMHTDYSIVENNIVYDNWGLGIDLDKCSYATVKNNLIYYTDDENWWRRGTVGSATRPADGIFISNEYTQPSGDPYPSGHDRVITNNVIVGAGGGIFFWSGDGNYENNALINDLIEKNTIVINQGLNSQAIIINYGPHSNTKIKNNIVRQDVGTVASVSGSGLTFSYNLWYSLNGITGIGDVRQDPLLTSDYHLKSSSPACTGGEGGAYMGAFPCAVTPTPAPDCVMVVWDKGLNMRWGPSMRGTPSSFLDEGFRFIPLDIVEVEGYGTAVKVAEPNWYIFMDLEYRPLDTYAVVCVW